MASDEGALRGYVPEPWSQELTDALDGWGFGALTPVPPFMWAQHTEYDPVLLTEVDAGDAAPEDLIVADGDWACDEGSQVVGGLVVSQTCDVAAKGPGERHVTVQVSPVVRVDSLNQQRRELMEKWGIVDRALLDPPSWEGTFVADLRLSVPMSKAVLARHEPVPAFTDEHRMLMLAEHVATKIRRPALHDFLSETVRNEIRQEIKSAKGDSQWWAPVEEILVSTTPDRLNPTHAQLIVVAQRPLSPKAKQRWHDLVERFVKRGAKARIVMQAPNCCTAKSLKADVYRRAVKLHIPELRSPY